MCMYSSTRLLGAALVISVLGCGGDLTLPADGAPSTLQAVSGDGQEGIVGSQLPDPLVVQLTDGVARPLPGVPLKFDFQSDIPAAKIEPSTIMTDDTGFASVRVRLGSRAGSQKVEASLADDADSDLRTTFALMALAKKSDDKKKGNDEGGGGDERRGKGKGHGHGDDDEEDDD